MILDGEDWKSSVFHPLQSLIVQVDLGEFDLFRVKGLRIDAESVILGGDGDLSSSQIFDRLIRPSMTEFQLKCFSPESEAQELVTQTDAEDRFFSDELAHRFNGIR